MRCILAIDGGGSHTRAGLYTPEGALLAEAEAGPTNLTEALATNVSQAIAGLGRRLAKGAQSEIGCAAAAISGAGRSNNAAALAGKLAELLQVSKVLVTSDALALFFANCSSDRPLLVTAGTGSSIVARGDTGAPILTGGLGPILGDEGGAYRIAVEAIRRAKDDADLLNALKVPARIDVYDQFILWVKVASNQDVAALATTVLELARHGNAGARACLQHQARLLAEQTLAAASNAGLTRRAGDGPITAIVQGGLFSEDSPYWEYFGDALDAVLPGAILEEAPLKGHRAALELALTPDPPGYVATSTAPDSARLPATEQPAEERIRLDTMSPEEIVSTMSTMESSATHSVMSARGVIGEAIQAASDALARGGRIIYVGAGTSGRLGVLDAAECPPTFGVGEDRVLALIAGGEAALRRSVEGAEDDTEQAIRDLEAIDPALGPNDIVIGISASGTTPYVLAALERARSAGARTALVSCNPVPLDTADTLIALDTGPEVLPGSTRLKAGTATKIVLNQISTGAMAIAGYVYEGRMVGVRPVNRKLRQRCVRIVSELTQLPAEKAEELLDSTQGSIPVAVIMDRQRVSATEAQEKLAKAGGNLRAALEGN